MLRSFYAFYFLGAGLKPNKRHAKIMIIIPEIIHLFAAFVDRKFN
jgi:hypothetical protein